MDTSDSEMDRWEFATTIDGRFLLAQAHLRLNVAMEILPTLIAENNRVAFKQPGFKLSRQQVIEEALKWADDLIKENARTAGLPPQYYQ